MDYTLQKYKIYMSIIIFVHCSYNIVVTFKKIFFKETNRIVKIKKNVQPYVVFI